LSTKLSRGDADCGSVGPERDAFLRRPKRRLPKRDHSGRIPKAAPRSERREKGTCEESKVTDSLFRPASVGRQPDGVLFFCSLILDRSIADGAIRSPALIPPSAAISEIRAAEPSHNCRSAVRSSGTMCRAPVQWP